MMLINNFVINVSTEKSVDFYKTLGFEEQSRCNKENEVVVILKGCLTVLELHIVSNLNKLSNGTYGLKNICFKAEKLEGDFQEDEKGKFKVLSDPDGLQIVIREIKPNAPEGNWYFSE